MTDNHTIMILYPTFKVWITLLTSHNKDFKEYRFTFSDGVVRYATLAEIKASEFNFIIPQIMKLEAVDEGQLGYYDGHLYVNSQIRKPAELISCLS